MQYKRGKAVLATYLSAPYIIIPPLIVAYVDFVNTKAGFRNRPVLTVLLLVVGAIIGTFFQLTIHYYLGMPETIVALLDFTVLFIIFEWLGKFFAPVGAITLIPVLLMASSSSTYRRDSIHHHRYDIFPKVLSVVTCAAYLVPDSALSDQPIQIGIVFSFTR